MSILIADTHSIIWFLNQDPKLSAIALAALRQTVGAGQPILLSAISIVEVCYLVDKGRLPPAALARLLQSISNGQKSAVELVPVGRAVAEAVALIPRAAVPDMPDRIIAATALHLGVPLVSRDRKIQASSINTIW
jgi:PIN domain nuclease of toxin-antitoxin system